MSYEVTIDHKRRLVASRWRGQVDESVFNDYIAAVWGDGSCADYNELLDFSAVDDIALDGAAVERLTRRSLAVADPDARARSALVAPQALVYGLSRMYVSLREANEPQAREWLVTGHLEEARRWLVEQP